MQLTPSPVDAVSASPCTPWSLRAWPPLLWQAGQSGHVRFEHRGTHVSFASERDVLLSGQTLWSASSAEGEAGVAWDWIQITQGVVAMADPMSVITNLRFVSDEGEVLTAWQAARILNALVHALPWQHEVARMLAPPRH